MAKTYDCIVIGAGVAGLTCARELMRAGKDVQVLEARARTGGRAHTVNGVELGAEFVHGAKPFFIEAFADAGLPIVDVNETRFYSQGGNLKAQPGMMDKIKKATARLNSNRKTDRSAAEFLEDQGRRIGPQLKPLVASYLENFHAAELDKAGEKALALNEQDDEGELQGKELFRPVSGYGALIDCWLKEMPESSGWLQLESLVQKITWRKTSVTVSGRPFAPLNAKTVAVTVPLGVLKGRDPHSQILFEPVPTGLDQAIAGLEVGHVERITFEFSHRFWEDLADEPIGFMQGDPSDYFCVWWTQSPLRTPYLVAWQGGPRAREVATWPKEKQIAVALRSLAKITGKSLAYLKKMVKAAHLHNWDSDPYALGAYSYIGIDGLRHARRLARPFEDTLFFAGEATAEASAQATVHGAMQSGQRAARQILAVL